MAQALDFGAQGVTSFEQLAGAGVKGVIVVGGILGRLRLAAPRLDRVHVAQYVLDGATRKRIALCVSGLGAILRNRARGGTSGN